MAREAKGSQFGGGHRERGTCKGPSSSCDQTHALYGGPAILGSGACVQASLCFHRVLLLCLHAPECVACHGIQGGLNGQAGFLLLHTSLHFGDERGDAGCTAASHLPGRNRQGGH